MDNLEVNTNEIFDFIIDTLYETRMELSMVDNIKFHHNTSYQNAPLVCEYGILTLLDLNKFGIRNDSKELLERYNDIESHINGTDGISLAVMGLTDLYKDESEYNPFEPRFVDITLSDELTAYRNTYHYGNEYICNKSIGVDKIQTIDMRIIEYIDRCRTNEDLKELIDMYNNSIKISKTINQNNLSILLREMSYNDKFIIDTKKLALAKHIIIDN